MHVNLGQLSSTTNLCIVRDRQAHHTLDDYYMGGVAPMVALAIYQSNAVANLVGPYGYFFAAVMVTLSQWLNPRAMFMKIIMFNVLPMCIASIHWDAWGLQRCHKSENIQHQRMLATRSKMDNYNSSAWVISAIWFCDIWCAPHYHPFQNNFGLFNYNSTGGFATPSEIIGHQSYKITSDHSIVGRTANGEASYSRIHTRFLDHDSRFPYNTPGGDGKLAAGFADSECEKQRKGLTMEGRAVPKDKKPQALKAAMNGFISLYSNFYDSMYRSVTTLQHITLGLQYAMVTLEIAGAKDFTRDIEETSELRTPMSSEMRRQPAM
ncbi:hypothetical protein PAAG_01313 [Paracoccidioides lutzii Pb01]|uniref:Uncharacterized protein n=1 Tax=Paracoccidioides lutzii (strain ATCC MYA-826 / Pb01) TaxID=502779 RepID=C1GS18_PARBA|nr:hypothetical protein PAAG_01313 [Paracoccidioides lutzii Pb01]EEH38392.2 hypothetical protein PAAG_01313 [Paracoccidioides lutzii Pb01]